MIITETKIKGLYIIEPELRVDGRGFFTRTFCERELGRAGIKFRIRQINRSLTGKKGTIRGMHFQKHPRAEDKIVSCLRGRVFDVAIDLRPTSPTRGSWLGVELSEKNKKALLIPKGFAHGFQSLTVNCEMLYLMSEFYSPEHASGVRWDDPLFGIKWPLKKPTLADKDKNWLLVKRNKN